MSETAVPLSDEQDKGSQPSQFVIYCVRRTGSFHLSSLLDSASDIVCHGELFRQWEIPIRQAYHKKAGPLRMAQRESRPLAFIKQIRQVDPGMHFGFKLFNQHVERVGRLQTILKNPSWKKIALLRDPVEVYASLQRALDTQRWAKKKGMPQKDAGRVAKVHFFEKSFREFSKEYAAYLRSVLDNAGKPDWLLVSYDRLNDLPTRQAVLDFLGSRESAQNLTSEFEKQFDAPVCEAFDNWDELTKCLERDNPFAGLTWSGAPAATGPAS